MNEFDLTELTQQIPYKWRVQSHSRNSATATCVAYIDARDVMNILDEVVGAENWQSDFKEIKGNLYGGLGLRINGEWIWKWDCGTESRTDGEKGESSDAFKRAAVKWGVGRFLYDIPIQFVKTNEIKNDKNYPYPVDDKGNKLRDLSLHLNKNVKITHFKRKDKRSDINTILESIKYCSNLDDLRTIRATNKALESTNSDYKNKLVEKYNQLQSQIIN